MVEKGTQFRNLPYIEIKQNLRNRVRGKFVIEIKQNSLVIKTFLQCHRIPFANTLVINFTFYQILTPQ